MIRCGEIRKPLRQVWAVRCKCCWGGARAAPGKWTRCLVPIRRPPCGSAASSHRLLELNLLLCGRREYRLSSADRAMGRRKAAGARMHMRARQPHACAVSAAANVTAGSAETDARAGHWRPRSHVVRGARQDCSSLPECQSARRQQQRQIGHRSRGGGRSCCLPSGNPTKRRWRHNAAGLS